jgi:hypothetical protein
MNDLSTTLSNGLPIEKDGIPNAHEHGLSRQLPSKYERPQLHKSVSKVCDNVSLYHQPIQGNGISSTKQYGQLTEKHYGYWNVGNP